MGEDAVKAAKSVNYHCAGTIEFLLDEKNNYYFMEMNTRIQVEHPVTEYITGIDLIKEQLRICSGQELTINQEDLKHTGHSIECRINAEDPDKNFTPCPGKITNYQLPGGPGIRIDSAAYHDYTIQPFYDSMIAKLITWGINREEAIARMKRALNEYIIEGVKTTIPFHKKVLNNRTFLDGKANTSFLVKEFS